MSAILNTQDKTSFLKIAMITGMVLLFLIPRSMIQNLVHERENRALEIVDEVVEGFGGSLQFVGPLLSIPWTRSSTDLRGQKILETGQMHVLPEHFEASGELQAHHLNRGIFKVPVYDINLSLSGTVIAPSPQIFPEDVQIHYNQAQLIVGIQNMQGIREAEALQWQNQYYDFRPIANNPSVRYGLSSSKLPLPEDGTPVEFSWNMKVAGGLHASFVPLGKNSRLHISGNWPSPSFTGTRLPTERNLDSKNNQFSATWDIPEVSRPIPPYWEAGAENAPNLLGTLHSEIKHDPNQEKTMISVKLLESIGSYARIIRTFKYSVLFLIIPFVIFLLFELMGALKVHLVQYILASTGNIMFYLLLLSFTERLGFNLAYVIAALGVTALLGMYTWNMSQRLSIRLTMPLVLALTYLWLWIILQSEDYALLIGTTGLFIIIALMMILTRKIDWYKMQT